MQRIVSRLRTEAVAVFGPPWQAWRASGPMAFPLGIGAAAVVALFGLIQHTNAGWWLIEHVAGVYQELPLHLLLLRLPLSMFAPAPDLPAWGATLQVLVVFGLAEIHLGRMRTLVTAVCVNALTTLSARIMVLIGLHLYIGTPQVDAYELDTGPSTVVVALCVYVALRCRAYLAMSAVVLAMTVEALALPNLAGREHMVALALGALAFLVGGRIRTTGGSPRPPGEGAALPRPASRP